MNSKLTEEDFKSIYSKVPRLCVDLVLKNEEGILLALRSFPPYKDMWNFPGGTLYKNETVEEAVVRIAKKETGLDVKINKFLGYIEYFNEKRFDIDTHTVSIVVEVASVGGELSHDENTSELKYFKDLPESLVEQQKEFLESNFK